jgi:hypothetical protein
VAPHLRMLRCVGVLERLAGCLMYIKEAMYISRTSASVAPVPHLRLLRWGACPCVSHTLVSCDGHTPWYPYYHSVHQHYKTEFRYIPLLCRVMHRDVHQQYVTEFRYMSSLSCQYPSHSITVHTRGHILSPFTTILLY